MTQVTEFPVEEAELVFNLPENNEFPTELFQGMDFEAIKKLLGNDFIVLQDKQVFTERIMTDEEISQVRAEYGEIAENELPEVRNELDELNANYKHDKEVLTAQITALNNKFLDLVSIAKRGIKEFELIADHTFRIPISGFYLTYTFTGTKLQLARVQRIPDSERYDLFNSSDKNKSEFSKLRYEFPESAVENRQNFRVFGERGSVEWLEVWEDSGMDIGWKHWKEDFIDEDTGEITTIDRTERIEISITESPYQNEPVEAQEGTSDELPEEPAE